MLGFAVQALLGAAVHEEGAVYFAELVLHRLDRAFDLHIKPDSSFAVVFRNVREGWLLQSAGTLEFFCLHHRLNVSAFLRLEHAFKAKVKTATRKTRLELSRCFRFRWF